MLRTRSVTASTGPLRARAALRASLLLIAVSSVTAACGGSSPQDPGGGGGSGGATTSSGSAMNTSSSTTTTTTTTGVGGGTTTGVGGAGGGTTTGVGGDDTTGVGGGTTTGVGGAGGGGADPGQPIAFTKIDLSVGMNPIYVAIQDLDGDGDADLTVANYGNPDIAQSSSIGVLLNQGNGSFAPQVIHKHPLPNVVMTGDLNGDGKADLAVTDPFNESVGVMLNQGNGGFASKVPYTAGGGFDSLELAAEVDLNGDGKLDLVVSTGGKNVNTLLNNGDGSFAPMVSHPTGVFPMHVAVGDVNGDGKHDLIATFWNNNAPAPDSVGVMLGDGGGNFAPPVSYTVGSYPHWVEAADLNGDGKLDIVVGNRGGGNVPATVSVLLNNGDGTFGAQIKYPTDAEPLALAVGDLTGDGKPEVAVTNWVGGTVRLLVNKGDGTFDPPAAYVTGGGPRGVAIGDVNGDGKLDLAVTNWGNGTVSVLINDGLAP